MKKVLKIAPAVATMVAAMMLVPAPAPALTYASCGGYYSRLPASCTFVPAAPNFSVYGQTYTGDVTIRITDLTGTITLVECSGYLTCSGRVGPDHTGTDSVGLPPTGPLLCQVFNGAGGYFSCASGI